MGIPAKSLLFLEINPIKEGEPYPGLPCEEGLVLRPKEEGAWEF